MQILYTYIIYRNGCTSYVTFFHEYPCISENVHLNSIPLYGWALNYIPIAYLGLTFY